MSDTISDLLNRYTSARMSVISEYSGDMDSDICDLVNYVEEVVMELNLQPDWDVRLEPLQWWLELDVGPDYGSEWAQWIRRWWAERKELQ